MYRKEPETAQSYIALIWVTFLAHVFLFVILLLNFLLAIISTAYDSLQENQELALLKSMNDLNQDYVLTYQSDSNLNENIAYLILATQLGEERGDEDDGITRMVRKSISKLD